MSNTEKRIWPCNLLGHKFQGRWSTMETVSYSPAIKELLARTDLDDLVASARMLILEDYERRTVVTRMLSGAEVAETNTYHGDVCVRCGLVRMEPKI